MSKSEIELAGVYVRPFPLGSDGSAPEELNQLAIDEPERAWKVVKIINSIPIKNEAWRSSIYAVLGCGALEEIIALHEETMLPQILADAKTDPVLRSELSVIYESSLSPRAWLQINALLNG